MRSVGVGGMNVTGWKIIRRFSVLMAWKKEVL